MPPPFTVANLPAGRLVAKNQLSITSRRARALASAKTDHDKTLLQRQITAADNQIDQLVYELYGLTDDEIGIVEGNERGDQAQ